MMGDFQHRSQFDNPGRYGRYANGRRDIAGALTDAVQQNPVAAALIGMGVLWLFAGGNRVSIGGGNGRESILGFAADGASRTGHALKSAAGTVTDTVSSGVSSAAHAVSGTVSSVTGAVTDAVSSAAGAVSESVSDAAHRISDKLPGADPGQDGRGQEYRNDMGDLYGRDLSALRQSSPLSLMRQNLADVFDRYPLALAAAGLALGAGAAAGLPLTEKEKSVLGKAGEAVVDRAREMGQQAASVANAALDEATAKIGGNPASTTTTF